jgi:uncharacterized protein YbjQ (UPF0145 family)
LIIVTSSHIEGKKTVKTLGMVRGSTIRARNVGRDMVAGLRSIVIQRMVEQAEKMGANAIVDTRFVTSMVMSGASELLVYGTAIVIE